MRVHRTRIRDYRGVVDSEVRFADGRVGILGRFYQPAARRCPRSGRFSTRVGILDRFYRPAGVGL